MRSGFLDLLKYMLPDKIGRAPPLINLSQSYTMKYISLLILGCMYILMKSNRAKFFYAIEIVKLKDLLKVTLLVKTQ